MEQHPPTILIAPEPPPFPAPPRSVDLSSLEFILAIIAVIAIPALIYTFFFSLKCPPSTFLRRRRRTTASDDFLSTGTGTPTPADAEALSDLKFQKDTHAKDVGSECPVCLSVFGDGEDIKQLSTCRHSFHAYCIDTWLTSQPNCPVCRAPVPLNKSNNNNNNNSSGSSNRASLSRLRDRSSDFHHGLPDAGDLV